MNDKIINEIVILATKIIKFKTVDGNDVEISKCCEFVANYFAGMKNVFIAKHMSNNVPSLVISNCDAKHFDILFNGHLDVVPGHENQFTPTVSNGRLIGRGAADMKASVAAMMVLAKKIFTDKHCDKKIGLMIVFDEEIGGQNGTKYLVEKLNYSASVVIVPDDMADLCLTTKEKGMIGLDVEFKGVPSHSSQPWRGESAVDHLVEFVCELRIILPKQKKETWVNTCNVGPIKSEHARNQLAGKSVLSLDIRFTEKFNSAKIIASVKKIAKKHNGIVKIVHNEPFVYTDPRNMLIKQFKKIAEETLAREVKFSGDHGTSDARFFTKQNVPVILFKPTSGGMHADNEWVELQGVLDFYNTIYNFCMEINKSFF